MLGKIGEKIFSQYDEADLQAKCSDESNLVDLAMGFVDEAEDLNSFCEPIKDGLSKVAEGELLCSQFDKGPDSGPSFGGPYGQEQYVPSCQPDEGKFIEFCKKQFVSEVDRRSTDFTREVKYECEEEWIRNKYDFVERCTNVNRQDPPCDKIEYVNYCISRNQYHQDKNPPGPQPSIGGDNRQCPQQPALPASWVDGCKKAGGQIIDVTDNRGCKLTPKCTVGGVVPSYQPPYPTGPYPSGVPTRARLTTLRGWRASGILFQRGLRWLLRYEQEWLV